MAPWLPRSWEFPQRHPDLVRVREETLVRQTPGAALTPLQPQQAHVCEGLPVLPSSLEAGKAPTQPKPESAWPRDVVSLLCTAQHTPTPLDSSQRLGISASFV